ncbi:predicted protein [Histoplasma capsulatum H143]|uniref:Uncharacterized protein n=1 Tax=Ajellomyces capsulatus (strain H143) TaxID=544712 RepID=C6HFJ9_AJECH|nr:predicted protein [Histoplasma capsulatum H143]
MAGFVALRVYPNSPGLKDVLNLPATRVHHWTDQSHSSFFDFGKLQKHICLQHLNASRSFYGVRQYQPSLSKMLCVLEKRSQMGCMFFRKLKSPMRWFYGIGNLHVQSIPVNSKVPS